MNDKPEPPSAPLMTSLATRLFSGVMANPQSVEDLLPILATLREQGAIGADVLGMLEGVLEVSDMQVRDIMLPRAQMVVLKRDAPVEEMLRRIIDSGHSRFPVIGENRDEVIGVALAKDVLSFAVEKELGDLDIASLLRPAVFVPESKRLNVLLREFRASRNHMAIVVDEYGGVAGLVTIEDVLEQIVGEIDDEHDFDDGPNVFDHGGDRYSVRALTSLEDFNKQFGTEFSAEDVDTVGGLIMKDCGYMPRRGEQRDLGGWRFRVLRADSRRIYLLQVTPIPTQVS